MSLNSYPTKLAEAFAARALEIFYQTSVADAITNSDYEGEIKDKASKLNVLTFGAIDAHAYTGADMTPDDLTESNAQLVTNQLKYIYFTVKDYDTFRSYIKNPESTVQKQVGSRMKQIIDQFVLGLWADVGAGNVDGTDYTTGTVTVTVDTGAVAGAGGASWDADMVGKAFKATGHTSWYRIASRSAADAIVIEDDSDDLASDYTGGALAGATYTIQADTALAVTKSTIFARVSRLATILTNNEIPESDRWLVLPASIATLLRQSDEFVGIGSESGRESVLNGKLPGTYAGFNIYEVADGRYSDGNSTDGWHVLGGHKSAICFAMGLTENKVEDDIIGNFGKRYKSLYVYGAKVPDERRKALVCGFWKL
jgi:hypothetical protein